MPQLNFPTFTHQNLDSRKHSYIYICIYIYHIYVYIYIYMCLSLFSQFYKRRLLFYFYAHEVILICVDHCVFVLVVHVLVHGIPLRDTLETLRFILLKHVLVAIHSGPAQISCRACGFLDTSGLISKGLYYARCSSFVFGKVSLRLSSMILGCCYNDLGM